MNEYKKVTIYYEHPRRHKNGTILEHLLVAGDKLGRPIKLEEAVHHIDEDKSNNDPNNLIVFKSRGEHFRFHRMHTPILIFDSEGLASCYIPKKMELEQKILETKSFAETAKFYGVDRRTIPEWCKSMDMPHKIDYYNKCIVYMPSPKELYDALCMRGSFGKVSKEYLVDRRTPYTWAERQNMPTKIKEYAESKSFEEFIKIWDIHQEP